MWSRGRKGCSGNDVTDDTYLFCSKCHHYLKKCCGGDMAASVLVGCGNWWLVPDGPGLAIERGFSSGLLRSSSFPLSNSIQVAVIGLRLSGSRRACPLHTS
jgi:hypothetical protein